MSSVWGRWMFPTKMTTLLLHEDMTNYSVWGRSHCACSFSIHIYISQAHKNEEFDLRISHKPRIGSSWNLYRKCIAAWWTTVASFSSIKCTVFEKMTIIIYSQFAFFSKSVIWVHLIFGEEMKYNGTYLLAKFQPNPVCSFWNIGSGNSAAIHCFHVQKYRIWFGHIFQLVSWILTKFGQGMHNIMKNNHENF